MDQIKGQVHCCDAYKLGLTGKGVGVAVLDTGIFPHKDFDSRILGFEDFVHNRSGPYDDCGHGSHICGIIGGSGISSEGRYQGMAPGCHLVALKVLDQKGNGYVKDVLAGISWILERKDDLGIRIVNISVGAGGRRKLSENSVLVRGVNQAWDAGLVVVVAAGNNGKKLLCGLLAAVLYGSGLMVAGLLLFSTAMQPGRLALSVGALLLGGFVGVFCAGMRA